MHQANVAGGDGRSVLDHDDDAVRTQVRGVEQLKQFSSRFSRNVVDSVEEQRHVDWLFQAAPGFHTGLRDRRLHSWQLNK